MTERETRDAVRHAASWFDGTGATLATLGLSRSCEDDVIGQLVELRRRAFDYAERDWRMAQEEYFSAEQNARLVRNAEQYYRSMFGNRAESWNLRDTHMVETLHALIDWSRKRSESPKAIVWAHNSHLGDARATQMSSFGEINVGQLVREQHGDRAFLVGFTTHDGTVTAARSHYFRAKLPEQFDGAIHVDRTNALTPLEPWAESEADLPETWPTGV